MSMGGDAAEDDDSGPDDRVLAEMQSPTGGGYRLSECASGFRLKIHGVASFDISADARRLACQPDPTADLAMLPLLMAASLPALILNLRNDYPLHSSAVEVGGRAIAFLGPAGIGKSTLAGLFCAAGARLVTDDLLRLRPDAEGFRCYLGPSELRLRRDCRYLARRMPDLVALETADRRTAVQFSTLSQGDIRLDAILLPARSPDEREPRLRRLSRPEALLALCCNARVSGLKDPERIKNRFEHYGRLARELPLYEARIPADAHHRRDLPDRLLKGLGYPPLP